MHPDTRAKRRFQREKIIIKRFLVYLRIVVGDGENWNLPSQPKQYGKGIIKNPGYYSKRRSIGCNKLHCHICHFHKLFDRKRYRFKAQKDLKERITDFYKETENYELNRPT